MLAKRMTRPRPKSRSRMAGFPSLKEATVDTGPGRTPRSASVSGSVRRSALRIIASLDQEHVDLAADPDGERHVVVGREAVVGDGCGHQVFALAGQPDVDGDQLGTVWLEHFFRHRAGLFEAGAGAVAGLHPVGIVDREDGGNGPPGGLALGVAGEERAGQGHGQQNEEQAADEQQEQILQPETTVVFLDAGPQEAHGGPTHLLDPVAVEQLQQNRHRDRRCAPQEYGIEKAHSPPGGLTRGRVRPAGKKAGNDRLGWFRGVDEGVADVVLFAGLADPVAEGGDILEIALPDALGLQQEFIRHLEALELDRSLEGELQLVRMHDVKNNDLLPLEGQMPQPCQHLVRIVEQVACSRRIVSRSRIDSSSKRLGVLARRMISISSSVEG